MATVMRRSVRWVSTNGDPLMFHVKHDEVHPQQVARSEAVAMDVVELCARKGHGALLSAGGSAGPGRRHATHGARAVLGSDTELAPRSLRWTRHIPRSARQVWVVAGCTDVRSECERTDEGSEVLVLLR